MMILKCSKLSLIFWVMCLSAEYFHSVEFHKSGVKLPDFLVHYDYSDYEQDWSGGEQENRRALLVDTGRALFDSIVIDLVEQPDCKAGESTGHVTVYDEDADRVWMDTIDILGDSTLVLHLDYDFIAAAPLEGVRIIDSMQYNGDFIAPFHIEYLYDYIDEFIIVEARYTHNGERKPFLYFHRNSHLFAPFMNKITYVVIDEFPPPPDAWNEDNMPFITPGTDESYWNENYQYTFPKFYIKPSHENGSRQIILVSDADEFPSRQILLHIRNFESDPTLPMGKKSFDRPVHICLLFFYYNFRTINKVFWIQEFALNTDSFLNMDYPLDMRSYGFRSDSYYPGGYLSGDGMFGWHLSYFMSLQDMVRKVESFSAAAEIKEYNFKSEEHIRYCMTHHQDIFNRTGHTVQWTNFFDNEQYEIAMLPDGWETWQENLDIIQSASLVT